MNVLTERATLLIVDGGVNVNFTPVGMQEDLSTRLRKSRPHTASRFSKKCGVARAEVIARKIVVVSANECMAKSRKGKIGWTMRGM